MLKQKKDIHEDITSSLPWLVNGSLSGKERERVLEHLLVCERCREARDEMQSVMALVAEDDGANENYQNAFRTLQRRIDAAEREKQVLADFDLQASDWWAQLNQSMSWLFSRMHYVTATVVLVVGVVYLSPQFLSDSEADNTYRTLTSGLPVGESNYHRAIITFAPSAESEVIRDTLIKTNSKIVRNSEERYVVDIEMPSGVSEVEFFDQVRNMDSVISVVSIIK